MWGQGRKVGFLVVVLILLFTAVTLWYTDQLATEREAVLATMEAQECVDNPALCPQADNLQVPDTLGIGIVIIAVLLALYLFKSDHTQQQILRELRHADEKTSDAERQTLILSVLKKDEKKIILAVKEQEGITQNTLALRTDFSKAKLSGLLKELEARKLIKKEPEGKTNKIFLKRKL